MAQEKERRRTVPIFGDEFQWWTDAVKRRLKEPKRDLTQEKLAEQIGEPASAVSRCINREVPVYELIIAISNILELPYPVFLAESYDEALRLAEERRLFKRDVQLREIAAGAMGSSSEDQTGAIASTDATKRAGRKPKASNDRARARH